MADSSRKSVAKQVQSELKELLQAEGLPFHRLLSLERIETALKRADVKYRKGGVYPPHVTLLAFLSQVMTGGSCEAAVARVIVHRIEAGLKPCSENTGSYCDARQKLPEAVISDLARTVGNEQQDQARTGWKWKGRDVEIVDGSTCPMADTEENQKEYPPAGRTYLCLGVDHTNAQTLSSADKYRRLARHELDPREWGAPRTVPWPLIVS